jgi:NADPH:quinone reductase-like Zn-dependent oxidoreductase
MATMKAVRIHEYGGPEVLRYEDAPLPGVGPDEVLIQVRAASVNPVDWVMREGYFKEFLPLAFPAILGRDVAGVIEAVGANVSHVKPGDVVMAWVDPSRAGAHAEYVAVPASQVAAKPQSVDALHAAAIPHAGLAAWQVLFDVAGLSAGQRVLIHAAAGGVGTFAVQLAKWKGAHVIGTASAHNLDFLRRLGVDEAIDYTVTRVDAVVRDVDVVVDTEGGETQQRSWGALKPGGILVGLYSPPSEEAANAHGVRHHYFGLQANPDELAELGGLVDAGHLKPILTTVLPLWEARSAFDFSQSRHTRGKIVLFVRE